MMISRKHFLPSISLQVTQILQVKPRFGAILQT